MTDKVADTFSDIDMLNLTALAELALDRGLGDLDGFDEAEIEHLRKSLKEFDEVVAGMEI